MSEERRYQDDEIEAIFDLATSERRTAPGRLPTTGRGLTLAELKEIGRDVGIAAEDVEAAALALDTPVSVSPRRTLAGLPVSVGREVDLPRAPTDHEWELLVTELRRTFAARGRLGSHGSMREWTNGNLHAFIEPTGAGHRLRLGTTKGTALIYSRLGALGLAVTLVVAVIQGMTGALDEKAAGIVILTAMFGGFLTAGLLPLPRWAREREEQMDHIAGRALQLVSAPARGAGGGAGEEDSS
jgi:hypothetical protein